ncbi:MAG TPA: tannase/feruloyl esterase family alpha/beta hydrolase [Steroidobacteraceae bacterium]|nr:tannase/feruloyl esterase family alpha/beta hydrolase [Steroidobacteraceae bacterium]
MNTRLLPLIAFTLAVARVHAQGAPTTCDASGIGAAKLTADGPAVQIVSVTTGTAGAVNYCLVKVLVPKAVNIWVGLPMGGAWNGRWQSVGGGAYAGAAAVPTEALREGYAAATTDTGHAGGRPDMPVAMVDGSFGMLAPGKPDVEVQRDFAYRSEHLMAVIGKQLVAQFYGKAPQYSYWNGCSTGGRQGLRMAQDYPQDYDGILAGAPAIHWDRFQAAMLWPQVVQQRVNGGLVGGGDRGVMAAKFKLATDRAIAACDALDGVTDGILGDPRRCGYEASEDHDVTQASCTAGDGKCLTPGEAAAIDRIWQGPVACADGRSDLCAVPEVASRDLTAKVNRRLWYGEVRGTDLMALAGPQPFQIAVEQPRFWVYFDPAWDWHKVGTLDFVGFFRDTVARVGPMMASENPDLSAFRRHGGKLVLYHGWSDQLIMPQGTIEYYDQVTRKLGGGYARTQQFARLFMAPGVGHCSGGAGPQPQRPFDAVVKWVEKGVAPETITASRSANGTTQTRPLCPYPAEARWKGTGSTDDAANFECAVVPRR